MVGDFLFAPAEMLGVEGLDLDDWLAASPYDMHYSLYIFEACATAVWGGKE